MNVIAYLISLFLCLPLAVLSQKSSTQVPQEMPEFTFFTLDKDQPFTKSNLASNSFNRVIIFFDPGCSHCQEEVKALSQNYAQLKQVNLYFVAMQEKSLINAFMTMYGGDLKGKKNVTLLQDKNYEFISRFNPSKYPATYVYGADNKLKKYWDGDKKINEIIAAINTK